MKTFSVEFSIFAPSDEGMPFRKWKVVVCEDKNGVERLLRNHLISNGSLEPGEYITIWRVIEER